MICSSHLSQIESGLRKPSLAVLARLCETLGCADEMAVIVQEAWTLEACHGGPAKDDAARGAA
jgi:transcriptional regulator with XRE-family HTH domain